MKTTTLLAALTCCISLIVSQEASANSFRVNQDKRANANFLDLNTAMASGAVTDGDTLYVDKGCTISTQQTITKEVTIIGPGYFIGENDADEAYFSNDIFLEADNIKLTGLHTSTLYVRANDIVIERCRVTGIITGNQSGYENDNVSIRSCFIVGCIQGQGSNGSNGWNILNNIIYHIASANEHFEPIYSFQNAVIDHNSIRFYGSSGYTNYLHCIYDVFNSTITNNIIEQTNNPNYIINTYTLSSNNIISHNLLSSGKLNDYPNNICYGSQMTTYVYKDYYDDSSSRREACYTLTDESPAKGYAEDGGDCGPFDGAYPYVLSGYPLYVPRFESITVPSQPGSDGKLHIQMVIKNQNE